MREYYNTPDGKIITIGCDKTIVHQNVFPRVIISLDDFNALDKNKIKSHKANEILNNYYKNINDTWLYNNGKYKKMPNFEKIDGKINGNYPSLPFHDIHVYGKCYLVWHRGKVYYHSISYNGCDNGHLIDTKTMNSVKWCSLKNCAPIKNLQTGELM